MSTVVLVAVSLAAVCASCLAVWLLTRRAAERPGPRRRVWLVAAVAYVVPVLLAAVVLAAWAAIDRDGQWVWLGETMAVEPQTELRNNLFVLGMVTLPFFGLYTVAGFVTAIAAVLWKRERVEP